jgi:predicted Zn-ribbon and HTH transcriptional regulator
MATDLTDLLDEMDDRRGETHVLEDLDALIKAARMALAQHQVKPGMFPPECTSCGYWDDDIEEFVAQIWPCPTVDAISAALLGGTDGN